MQKYLPTLDAVVDIKRLFDYKEQVLSLIGDGVHTLFVRTMLSNTYPYSLNSLHTAVCKRVCAQAQAAAMEKLIPLLNENEDFIFRKCKNAKTNNIPKHASLMEYKYATAFEGLIGFLYLSGQNKRLEEILNFVYSEDGEK